MQAPDAATIPSDATQWRIMLGHGALLLAATLGITALIFWLAANWPNLTPPQRLALGQAVLILLSIAAAGAYTLGWRSSKLLASLAAIAVGAVLALVGQIYQTGADPWALYALWALLVLPWLILQRSLFLWLLWISLLNLALWRWLDQSPVSGLGIFAAHDLRHLYLVVLNFVLLAATELAYRHSLLVDRYRIARHLIAAGILAWLWLINTMLFFWQSYAGLDASASFLILVALLAIGLLYVFYTRIKPDLVVIALSCIAITGYLWHWLWPFFYGLNGLLAITLILFVVSLLLLHHVYKLALRYRFIGDDGAPWLITTLRISLLLPLIALLALWLGIQLQLTDAFDALVFGIICLVIGLASARLAQRRLSYELSESIGAVGLFFYTAATVFLDGSRMLPLAQFALLGILLIAVFTCNRNFFIRFTSVGLVLTATLWLTWPNANSGYSGAAGQSFGNWPSGLYLRLFLLQLVAIATWILSLRPYGSRLWRPIAWVLLLWAPALALAMGIYGVPMVQNLPSSDALAALATALLPAILLASYLHTHKNLPVSLRLGAPLGLALSSLAWVAAPLLAVALTWFYLAWLAQHRILQVWAVLLGLAGLLAYYFDTRLLLLHKAGYLLGASIVMLVCAYGLYRAVFATRQATALQAIASRYAQALHNRPLLVRAAVLCAAGLLALGVSQAQVMHYQNILKNGTSIRLQLAPLDPRSLLQGDYMELDYVLRGQISTWLRVNPKVLQEISASGRGCALLRPDSHKVWQLVGVSATAAGACPPSATTNGQTLTSLAFYWRHENADWGANHWFFTDGAQSRYAQARYGILKVAKNGTALLADLEN